MADAREPPPVPHYRDWFADHRFSPYLMAPSGAGCWVMEMMLPALVFVDERSGAAGGRPHVLDSAGRQRQAYRLIEHDDVLWIAWNDGVTRYDPRTRDQTDLGVTPIALASDGPALYGLLARGQIVRLDERDRDPVAIARLPILASHLAAGRRSVFGLARDETLPGVTTLTALDLEGRERYTVALEGAPYDLVAERDVLWVHLWRAGGPFGMSSHVIEVDPADGSLRGEREIPPTGLLGPVVDGHHIRTTLEDVDAEPSERRSRLERVDLRTGAGRPLARLDGWIAAPVLGASAIWGRPETNAAAGSSTVVAVPLDGSPPRRHDLSGVDTSSYRPPPPPPIEAEEVEREVRDRLAAALFGGWLAHDADTGEPLAAKPYIHGVAFEAVECRGAFPATEIVVTFRAAAHPGALLARKRRIWDDDGTLSAVIRYMDVNLMEDVGPDGRYLRRPHLPDATGIVWV